MQQIHTEAPLLVSRALDGDEAAFAALVRGCRGSMYAAALAITRNEQDALDAVQDAILRGWRKLPSLRERQFFSTWMTRIAINCAHTINRRSKPSAALIEQIPAPGTDLARRMDVRRAVDALDDKTRVCALLYYLEDVPVADIAKMTGAREGTVKSRLFRARAQLREVLKTYDE